MLDIQKTMFKFIAWYFGIALCFVPFLNDKTWAQLFIMLFIIGLIVGIGLIIRYQIKNDLIDEKQRKLSEQCLTDLILWHEGKRLVCNQLVVGKIYKQVLKFDQNEFFSDNNPNFLGGFRGIPVFYSPAIQYSNAMAMSETIGFPMTSMDEIKKEK